MFASASSFIKSKTHNFQRSTVNKAFNESLLNYRHFKSTGQKTVKMQLLLIGVIMEMFSKEPRVSTMFKALRVNTFTHTLFILAAEW